MNQKKPRDIKDLKARIGRPSSQAPSDASRGIVKPAIGRGAPGSGPIPHAALGSLLPPDMDIPRSGRIQPPEFKRHRTAPSPGADPFATAPAAPAGPREVRLVMDETPVAASEVGRKSGMRTLALVGVLAGAGGLVLGFAAGGTTGLNRIYNRTVQDGKDVYASVQASSKTVLEAQRLATKAMESARGAAGQPVRVDYASIEALRALKKPFGPNAFHRKHYRNFKAATVDDLFDYYTHVNLLWSKIETLAARTLPKANRELLDKAAKTAGEIGSASYGVVIMRDGENFVAGLTYIELMPGDANQQGVPKQLHVSTRRGGQQYTKTVYTGQNLTQNSDSYVIPIDKGRSMSILGSSVSTFAEYSKDVLELNQSLNETVEIQGRLETALGEIAKLSERFAFGK